MILIWRILYTATSKCQWREQEKEKPSQMLEHCKFFTAWIFCQRSTHNSARSLSFIFIISADTGVLLIMDPKKKHLVLNNATADIKEGAVNDNTLTCCSRIWLLLQNHNGSLSNAEGIVEKARSSCLDEESRTATRVIQDLLGVIWRNNKDSESNLLVEAMRPFFKRLIIDQDDQLQFEW